MAAAALGEPPLSTDRARRLLATHNCLGYLTIFVALLQNLLFSGHAVIFLPSLLWNLLSTVLGAPLGLFLGLNFTNLI